MLLPLNAWSNTASAILKWMLLIAYLAIALYLGELKEWLSGARAGVGAAVNLPTDCLAIGGFLAEVDEISR